MIFSGSGPILLGNPIFYDCSGGGGCGPPIPLWIRVCSMFVFATIVSGVFMCHSGLVIICFALSSRAIITLMIRKLFRTNRGLTVGLILLWYLVVCTVEWLSLFYLLFESWFACTRRWCIDVRGLSCEPNVSVSWSTSELWVGWRC